MPIDLSNIDPAIAKAGKEVDLIIARDWMGWKIVEYQHFAALETGDYHSYPYHTIGPSHNLAGWWSPSTNFAHAIEAMLRTEWYAGCMYDEDGDGNHEQVGIYAEVDVDGRPFQGIARFDEVAGDKGRALALATTRAILRALKAKEQ